MYSIDINLLRERTEFQVDPQTGFTGGTAIAAPKYGKVPMFIGMGVAVLALLAAGGGWWWLGEQTTQLEAKQKELDLKLGSLKAQDARLVQLNGQSTQIKDEAQSFASVFNQVQPWSAVLQDLRESIPQGVQIGTVSQSEYKLPVSAATAAATPAPATGGLAKKISTVPDPEAKPATTPGQIPTTSSTATYPTLEASIAAKFPPGGSAPTGAAAPLPTTPAPPLSPDVPTTKLDITGTAKSFDEVNNFILTLKQSAFFNPDDTQLITAGLMAPTIVERPKIKTATTAIVNSNAPITAEAKPNRLELPRLVEYKIQTTLKRVPAADLMRELERKGAVGLVARLRTLQQQQAIKP
jgi:type IV pilus assembly protein PilN